MATLINSSCFVFKTSLLRNYHVKYCDYIVKCCNGIGMRLVCIAGYFLNFSFNTYFVSHGDTSFNNVTTSSVVTRYKGDRSDEATSDSPLVFDVLVDECGYRNGDESVVPA